MTLKEGEREDPNATPDAQHHGPIFLCYMARGPHEKRVNDKKIKANASPLRKQAPSTTPSLSTPPATNNLPDARVFLPIATSCSGSM